MIAGEAGAGGTPPTDGSGPGVGGDESLRDVTKAPPMPTAVRVRGGRLEWQMPPSPRYVYQLTTNNSSLDDGQPWTQREVQNDPALTIETLGDGGYRFSYPVNGFTVGTTFRVEALHPWDIEVAKRGASSRFAAMPPSNPGGEIDDFLSTFDTSGNSSINGDWIGNRADWSSTPQFVDDFGGSSLSSNWYAADADITPAYSRDQTYSRDTAQVRDGKLEMTVDKATGQYSYLGTGNNAGDGYHVDASNGTFIEASVRLDKAAPADNAWWAFWLMNPDGGAYDGNVDTGSEVDIFEFVPDQNNGFNAAIYKGLTSGGCESAEHRSVARTPEEGDCFTYNTPNDIAGVTVPNYMDGQYHRLGMYYAHDRYAFYIDDTLIWQVTDPAFITKAEELSLRLTWELQNTNNPWTPSFGGNTKQSARDDDPTVYIDWVKVWEKGDGGTAPTDPESPVDPDAPAPTDPESPVDPDAPAEPLMPTDLVSEVTANQIRLSWTEPGQSTPAGYNIERDGEFLASVATNEYLDTFVFPGVNYTYRVSAYFGPSGEREYGPFSDELVVAATPGPGLVRYLQLNPGRGPSSLAWRPPVGSEVDGFVIARDGDYYRTLAADHGLDGGWNRWTDPAAGTRQHTYTVRAFTGTGAAQLLGPESSIYLPPRDDSGAEDGPPAVADLGLAEHDGVVLQWTTSDESVDGFVVKRDGVTVGDTSGKMFSDTTVFDRPGVYFYTVQPYYGSLERRYGPATTISVRVDANGVAGLVGVAPVRDVGVSQTQFQSELVVSWSAPDGGVAPAGYNIDRNGLFVKSVSGSPYYDRTVEFGQEYRYTIRPYYQEGAGTDFAPPVTSESVLVEAVPEEIRPAAPRNLEAKQSEFGRKVELSWTAPSGWEQGLIDRYEVFRNGRAVAEVDEVAAQTGLPTSRRVFIDPESDRWIPSTYAVRAYGTGGRASEMSETAFVSLDDVHTLEVDLETEPPLPYVRAAENVLGASGPDAYTLGSTLYALEKLIPLTWADDEVRPLLDQLEASLARLGKSEHWRGITDDEVRDFPRRAAGSVTRSIGTAAAEHLTSIYGDHGPDMAEIDRLVNWMRPSDLDVAGQVKYIREESEVLQEMIEAEDLEGVKRSSGRIATVAMGGAPDADGFLKFFQYSVDDGWLYGISDPGYGPPRRTPARDLFDAATPEQRLEYFGIDPEAYEFARPFIDLQDDANAAILWSQQEQSEFGMWIGIIITVFASVVAPGLGSVWAQATFLGFTTFIAASAAGADDLDALEEGAKAFLSVGVTYYVGLSGKTWWQTIAHASLAAATTDGDPESVFLETIAKDYVGARWGDDAWVRMEPYIDLIVDLVIAVAIDGEDDLGEYADRFEQLLFSEAGRAFGEFVADSLPDDWGTTTVALGELAGYSVTVGGDSDRIRAHFYDTTLPQLAESIGDSLVDALGGEEEFLNRIMNDLIVIGIRVGVDPTFTGERAFEKMVYENAAIFLSGQLRAGLISLNDGQSSFVIDTISEVVEIAVTYSFDPDERRTQLEAFRDEFLIEALVELLPACVSDEDQIRDLSIDMIRTVRDTDDPAAFGANAADLIRDGIWLGDEITASCSGPDDPDVGAGDGDGEDDGAGEGGDAGDGDGAGEGTGDGDDGESAGNVLIAQDGYLVNRDTLEIDPEANAQVACIPVCLALLLPVLPSLKVFAVALVAGSAVKLVHENQEEVYDTLEEAVEDAFLFWLVALAATDVLLHLDLVNSVEDEVVVEYFTPDVDVPAQRLRVENLGSVGEVQERSNGAWRNIGEQVGVERNDSGQVIAFTAAVPTGGTGSIDSPYLGPGDPDTYNYENDTEVEELEANGELADYVERDDEMDHPDWQIHHLIPVSVLQNPFYEPMLIQAVERGFFTDEAQNGQPLPGSIATQADFFNRTGICLPTHIGYTTEHRNWTANAEADMAAVFIEWDSRLGSARALTNDEVLARVRGVEALERAYVLSFGVVSGGECTTRTL